ncbi:MAG: hypothetical protein COA32_10220 [Fluviicola sp.]|nr:MAG: hypothetical protein COA32_10220 [Fluviicola sp.]
MSCSSDSEQSVSPRNTEITPVNDSNNYEFEGKWILTEYIDSIIIDKSISKHRMKELSWTAIVLDISDSLIKSYGSIMKPIDTIRNLKSDTLGILNHWGTKWQLSYNRDNSRLEAVNLDSLNEKYTFRRMTDDENKIIKIDTTDHFQIRNGLTNYFTQNIFTGKYIDILNNDTIVFHSDGSITGSRKYISFKPNIYFGTSHPFRNKDVIYLYNNDSIISYLNWKYSDRFITFTYFSRKRNEDSFDLTNKSFKYQTITAPNTGLAIKPQ